MVIGAAQQIFQFFFRDTERFQNDKFFEKFWRETSIRVRQDTNEVTASPPQRSNSKGLQSNLFQANNAFLTWNSIPRYLNDGFEKKKDLTWDRNRTLNAWMQRLSSPPWNVHRQVGLWMGFEYCHVCWMVQIKPPYCSFVLLFACGWCYGSSNSSKRCEI